MSLLILNVFQDVRRLERKVSKMSKTLRKLGYIENDEDDFDDTDAIINNNIKSVDDITSSSVTPPSTTPVTSPTTTSSGLCPGGWTNIGEGCYQVVTSQ